MVQFHPQVLFEVYQLDEYEIWSLMCPVLQTRSLHNEILHLEGKEKKKKKKGSTILKLFQWNVRYDAIQKNMRWGEKSEDERFSNKIT